MIVSKREKVVQGVVAGIAGGVGKPPMEMVAGRFGSAGVPLGSPRVVVGGTGIEGTTGSPGIVGRPGFAVGMEEILGVVAGRMPGTVDPIGILGTTGSAGREIAGIVEGTGTIGTTGIGRTGTGRTGTVGTMATGGRAGNVWTVGIPAGSA